MRPPTDVRPKLDILERLAAQRRVTNNHLKKKGDFHLFRILAKSSPGTTNKLLCSQPDLKIRESKGLLSAPDSLRRHGSLVLSETFYFWDGYGVMVLTPPFSGAVLPHLESDLQSGCTCFLLPHRAAHLWVFHQLGLTPVGLFPKLGQDPGTVCC